MKQTEIADRIARDVLAGYPDSAPTEEDRKKWREQAEERRRKEGIRPRKGDMRTLSDVRSIQDAAKAVARCRMDLITNSFEYDELRSMIDNARAIAEESGKIIRLCQRELQEPIAASVRQRRGNPRGEWVTVAQVREACPSCADRMERFGMKRIRQSALSIKTT
jgi:hypothetical protein